MFSNYGGLWGGGVQLPQGQAPTSFRPNDILASYNANHAASRNANQQLLDRTAAGFERVLANQQSDLAGAFRHLAGTNRSNMRSIDRRFRRESGDMAQTLIDRGLGNSTVQGSMQTGLTRAHADAVSEGRAQFGTRMYQAASQNALANSGLASQQLQFLMANTNIGYPDLGAYAGMAAQGGQSQEGLWSLGTGGTGGFMGSRTAPDRPIGGMKPMSSYYSAGDMSGWSGAPSSGMNIYSGYGGMAGDFGGGMAGPNMQSIMADAPSSAWARTSSGDIPNYQVGPQLAASGYGGKLAADYSGVEQSYFADPNYGP